MILILGLNMISKRIPAIVFGTINQASPQRVKADIGKTAYQRLALIDDNTFEAVSQKIRTLSPCYAKLQIMLSLAI